MSLQLLATSSTTAIEMPSVSTLPNLKASLVFATKASPGTVSAVNSRLFLVHKLTTVTLTPLASTTNLWENLNVFAIQGTKATVSIAQ